MSNDLSEQVALWKTRRDERRSERDQRAQRSRLIRPKADVRPSATKEGKDKTVNKPQKKSTVSPITKRLRATYGGDINKNGQQMGNVAFLRGKDAKGVRMAYVHMRCAFCGHTYFADQRVSGRISCAKCCDGLGETVTLKTGESVTRSEIVPRIIDKKNFYALKAEIVDDERAKKNRRKVSADSAPSNVDSVKPTDETTVGGTDAGSQSTLDRQVSFDALLADDGEIGADELAIDIDNCAELGRSAYLDRRNGQAKVWEETSEATRDAWRKTARVILAAAGVRV